VAAAGDIPPQLATSVTTDGQEICAALILTKLDVVVMGQMHRPNLGNELRSK
jgi:hypothetical protein